MTAGEVEADAGGAFADTAADLEQAQTERVEVERRVALTAEPTAQRVEEPVGGGVQEQAELVGPEAVVTQAIGDAGALEVLDPECGLAAIDVPVVEGSGGSARVVTTKRVLGPWSKASAL